MYFQFVSKESVDNNDGNISCGFEFDLSFDSVSFEVT